MMSFIELVNTSDPRILKPLGTIHDANIGIVRKEHYESEMYKVKQIMESPEIMKTLNIELDIPIVADVKLGNWGVGKKLKVVEGEHRMVIA